jgi:hypothetical protein
VNKEEHDKLINSEEYKYYDALCSGDAITSPGFESSYDIAIKIILDKDNEIKRAQALIIRMNNLINKLYADVDNIHVEIDRVSNP